MPPPPRPIKSVTVYCSSSNSVHPEFLRVAFDLGTRLATSGRSLVYGGGKVGLMGEAARGCRNSGGHVVGIITQRLKEAEQLDPDNQEVIIVDTMRERKRLLEHRGEAIIVLPGGLGTMEEFFEVLVGRLLGEHDKPIIILNCTDPDVVPGAELFTCRGEPIPPRGFYDPLLTMIDYMIASRFAKAGVKSLYKVCRSASDAMQALEQFERDPGAKVDTNSLVPSGPGA